MRPGVSAGSGSGTGTGIGTGTGTGTETGSGTGFGTGPGPGGVDPFRPTRLSTLMRIRPANSPRLRLRPRPAAATLSAGYALTFSPSASSWLAQLHAKMFGPPPTPPPCGLFNPSPVCRLPRLLCPPSPPDSFVDGRIRLLRRAVPRGPLAFLRSPLSAVLVENSDMCPVSKENGHRVLPDESEWVVGLVAELVDVALARRRPYKYHPRMTTKPSHRFRWLLPVVIAAEVRHAMAGLHRCCTVTRSCTRMSYSK